jgi:hypothetical protein
LYKAYIKNPTDGNKIKYKKIKNNLRKSLEESEKIFHQNQLKQCNDIQSTWKTINNVLNKETKQRNISLKHSDTSFIYDSKIISETFNNHFNNAGKKLGSEFPCHHGNDHMCYLTSEVKETMFLYPTCEIEVMNIVNSFKNKKSCGFDKITMSMLKLWLPNILIPLVHILNLSLSTGIFPSKLKIAKIIPVHKSGDKHEVNNYRPISLLFPNYLKNCITLD